MQLGVVLGLVLALVLGIGLHYGARVFTKDVNVLNLIGIGIPVHTIYTHVLETLQIFYNRTWFRTYNHFFRFQFVAATQPINCLAFVFDGVNFGASDFAYSAYSMVSSLETFISCCQHIINTLCSQ